MKTSHAPSILFIGALLLTTPLPAAPATAPADDASLAARPLIENLVAQLLAILRDPNISKPDRRQKVKDLAYAHMDFESLSRLTLGPHWKELSESQRKDFMEEYRQHLTATYGHTSDEYTDEDISVFGDRQEKPNGDWIVQTRIIGSENGGPRKEIAKVEYRLRNRTGPWKIIDVTIDGVSLVTNFRSQFQEIIANGGIDHLIKMLHDKNTGASK